MRRLFTLWLAVLLPFSNGAAAATVLRLGYSDVENFPYQMGNGEQVASPPGIAVELVREAAREIGAEIELFRLPVKRLFVDMLAGRLDGAFIFSFKEDRLQYGHYPMRDGVVDASRRIASLNYVFYKRAGDDLRWDGSALLNLKAPVGINFAFSIADDLKRLNLAVDDSGKSTQQNFSKLLLGRIGAYATLEDSGDTYLRRNRQGKIVKLMPPIVSRDYFVMLSKKMLEQQPDFAEKFWTQIGILREKRSAAMLDNYIE